MTSEPPVLPEERELSQEAQRRLNIATMAREFIICLGSLTRQYRVHAANNEAVVNQLKRTQGAIAPLREDSPFLSLVFAEGHAFTNGIWVRTSRFMAEHATELAAMLKRLNAQGLILEPAFTSNDIGDLAVVLLNGVQQRLKEGVPAKLNISGVRLIPIQEEEPPKVPNSRAELRQQARDIMQEGLLILDHSGASNLDLLMRKRQRSLIQKLIKLAEESVEDLLLITAIRDPTLPPQAHTLSVTIFSVVIGRIIGLSRTDLLRLGIAAINHNIGTTFLDPNLTARPRDLNSDERGLLETHSLSGLLHVLYNYGFAREMLDRAIAAAEHHIHWDGRAGYPFAPGDPIHPFSRIISTCDVFNALISERPHRSAFPPNQALKLIARNCGTGKQLDTSVAKTLMCIVGQYPPGTVVELDTGEWAVVIGPGIGASPLKRPHVLLIADEDGFELKDFVSVDLGDRHPRRRAWKRTIVRAQEISQLDMRPSAYLLADRIEETPGRLDSVEFAERAARQRGA